MSPDQAWNWLVTRIGERQARILVGIALGAIVGVLGSEAKQANVDPAIVATAATAGALTGATSGGQKNTPD